MKKIIAIVAIAVAVVAINFSVLATHPSTMTIQLPSVLSMI